MAAITRTHDERGLESPTRSKAVQNVMRGIRRESNRTPEQAPPLLTEHLIWTLAEIWTLTKEGASDPPSEHYIAEDGDVERGRVSKIAFQFSPTFKSKFVAPAPTLGGSFEYETLKGRLLQQPESRDQE